MNTTNCSDEGFYALHRLLQNQMQSAFKSFSGLWGNAAHFGAGHQSVSLNHIVRTPKPGSYIRRVIGIDVLELNEFDTHPLNTLRVFFERTDQSGFKSSSKFLIYPRTVEEELQLVCCTNLVDFLQSRFQWTTSEYLAKSADFATASFSVENYVKASTGIAQSLNKLHATLKIACAVQSFLKDQGYRFNFESTLAVSYSDETGGYIKCIACSEDDGQEVFELDFAYYGGTQIVANSSVFSKMEDASLRTIILDIRTCANPSLVSNAGQLTQPELVQVIQTSLLPVALRDYMQP